MKSKLTKIEQTSSLPKNTLIKLTDIKKQYGKKVVLTDINLEIKEGDRIGIIGPNGGGKSTLSEIIAGIRKPTSGKIEKREGLVLGIQFQESRYPLGITVIDMIKYYLETFSIQMKESELTELMRIYQILGFQNKYISSLSGGQQQRLNILLGLIHNPDLVILDEVSTGLDIEVRTEILNFIKERVVSANKSLVLVTHMMSEIEDLCEKFIYIHKGEIREAGLVADIVKQYGSVHNYTWTKFTEEKKADLEKEYQEELQHQAEISKKHHRQNKFDKIIVQGKNKSKNIALITLLLKYYIKGAAVPFFTLVFPVVLIFMMGNIFTSSAMTHDSRDLAIYNLHILVGALAAMSALGVSFWIIPSTIIEFKTSVLLKRIGATNIKPLFFLLSILCIGFIFIIISLLWLLLWTGIIFGWKYGWASVSLPEHIGQAIALYIPIIGVGVSLGLVFASIFKSMTSFNAVINVIYMPINFLSGGFAPKSAIDSNVILNGMSWINPFKYSIDPFLKAWDSSVMDVNLVNVRMDYHFSTSDGIYLLVSALLFAIFIIIPVFKLKWQD